MRAEPVLPSADLDDTVEFYTSLGFAVTYDDRAGDGYVILTMDGATLHFFEHGALDATGNDAGAYLHVDDAHGLHQRWSALGLTPENLPRLMPVEDQPWGKREFLVVDPDGNVLRVGQDLPGAA
ncbi:MAG: VOC family protein [Gemmatimonadetes bacterium]|nr:VOC family protein [Gemmatimonadota bacterium]